MPLENLYELAAIRERFGFFTTWSTKIDRSVFQASPYKPKRIYVTDKIYTTVHYADDTKHRLKWIEIWAIIDNIFKSNRGNPEINPDHHFIEGFHLKERNLYVGFGS